MSGRTTRLVDKYVQELFDKKGEWVTPRDHFGTKESDKELIRRICFRMDKEHGITLDVNMIERKIRIPIEVAKRIKSCYDRMVEFRNNRNL